jgi:hypothetical protein
LALVSTSRVKEEVLARLCPVQLGIQIHGELVVAADAGSAVGRSSLLGGQFTAHGNHQA